MKTNSGLRTTFDEDAERYNRYRPHYPAELFDLLIRETQLTQYSTALEIGPGTGQATKPLAKLGMKITGVELGEALADKARKELSQYPRTTIITGTFEEIHLPAAYYDLVFSATAFHWIRDEYRFTKTAQALKPKGYLAVIHTEHISDDTNDLFSSASQALYDQYWPPEKPDKTFRLQKLSELKKPALDENLFALKSFTAFPTIVNYSAHDYAGLLSTYSPIIALPASKRHAFLQAIEALINMEFGGSINKRFAFTITVAQKKTTP